ncbi:hypothetical protein ACHQM5_030703 [Ranunculus cassubicifolius]
MGGYTPKCAVTRLGIRESRLALKDTLNHKDQDVHSCNRLGCSTTRFDCLKSSQVGTSDKTKNSKPSFRYASSKSVTGSCSKTYLSARNTKIDHKEPQHRSSKEATLPSKNSSVQAPTHCTSSILPPTKNRTDLSEADDVEFGVLKDTSVNIPQEVGEPSTVKTRMQVHKKSSVGNQDSFSRSLKLSSASNKVSQANTTSHSKAGFRKLGSTSISDGLSAGTSSSHLSHCTRAHMVKKKIDGECSTSGKNINGCGSSSGRISSSRSTLSSNPKLPRFGCPSTEQASKRNIKQTLSRVDVASVTSQKVMPKGSRRAQPKRPSPRDLAIHISPLPTSSQPSSTIRRNSYSRAARNNKAVDSRTTRDIEDTSANPVNGLSSNRDAFQHISTDGFAEVLLALERIEQDEDLTYEQRLVLESNLFLDGLGFLDHHSDMRMDIDNMSYEELLDLEEKMGTVSTALTEEALSKCLKKNFYTCLDLRSKSWAEDHLKCSICQDEFAEGDEVGRLGCEHEYHLMCIYQWLRQKNWCPVCKSPAAA